MAPCCARPKPSRATSWCAPGLDLARIELGRLEAARAAFENALAIDPHPSGARAKLEELQTESGGQREFHYGGITNENGGHIMSDITIIGLGLMGAALARAMQRAGHDLTVWNRSPAKMQPFIDDAVAAAPDVVSAIAASPVILICIDNYAATMAMLRSDEVTPILAGRTVVQLSTGTPREARESAAWMKAHDVSYLDGAILASPKGIGTDHAQILLSGDETAQDRTGHLLDCLGGDVRYLGTNVRAASALDLAWLCVSYGRFLAIIHAASLCKSEGVGMDEFISLFPDNPDVQHYAKVIHEESFHECTATLQVWGAALQRIRTQGQDAGINTDFPDFVSSLFKKAVDAGHGEENVMALVKVLRSDRGN